MVGGGSDVWHEHTEKIEDDARCGPTIVLRETPIEEDDAHDDTQQDASGMRPGVPEFLLMVEMNFEFHIA